MSKLLRDASPAFTVPQKEALSASPSSSDDLLGAIAQWRRRTQDGYELSLREVDVGAGLQVVAPDGRLCVTIHLQPTGLRIELFGAELHAHARDRMHLRAAHVEIAAEESLTLSSGGTIHQRAAGEVRSEAFEHHLESTHGEITLVANDDVALDGERIRLNSPAPWLPPHLRKRSAGPGPDEP
jgi:hypothetical protein